MPDTITLTGLVATEPRVLTTQEGLAITSFRLASSQRRFDRAQQKWVDGDTNWYTVTAFRQLATNCAVSIKRGERVVVTGKLKIRDWQAGEKSGTNVEIDAEALGHDLAWGTANFSRSVSSTTIEVPAGAVGASTESFPTDAELEAVTGIGAAAPTDAADTTDGVVTPF
jgi:single-strand DNA-binding protein